MFDALFTCPKVMSCHQAGPATAERQSYLVHRAHDEGIARTTLLRIAREVLVIAKWIDLGHAECIGLQDIETAAQPALMDFLRAL